MPSTTLSASKASTGNPSVWVIVSGCSPTPKRKAVSPPALMILSLIRSPGLAVKVWGSFAGVPLIR